MKSVVYFIREIRYQASPVKIGVSGNGERGARSRLSNLQVGNPRRLAIVAMMRGDRDTEADVHRKLAAFRIHGEWFRWCRPVQRMVETFALPRPIVAQEDSIPLEDREALGIWGK